jgi:hypothetical protein
VQRPECLAPSEGRVRVTSLVDGPVAGQHHDRADDRVDLFDTPEEGLDHLDGRDRALTDEPGDADRSALPDLIHQTRSVGMPRFGFRCALIDAGTRGHAVIASRLPARP